jgi:uncharacterized protein (DUF2062 family)
MTRWMHKTKVRLTGWLSQGLNPRQLAFTLALGFAVGCIPLLGVTTAICTLLAVLLRLNMPAIQAANWVAMPVQVALLVPFLRLGQWLFRGNAIDFNLSQILAQLAAAPARALFEMSGLLTHALFAWFITVGPACILLMGALTFLLSRIPQLAPAVAPAEAGD